MARTKVITSPSLKLYVNGAPFGNVLSFDFTITSQSILKPELDNMEPAELAPTSYIVFGRMGLYRLHGDGGLEGAGLSANAIDLPRQKYVTFALIDRVTDQMVFRCDKVWVDSQNWSVGLKGVVRGTLAFKGIGYQNEHRTSPAA